MPRPEVSPAFRDVACVALASAVFFFVGLGETSVVNADEAIYHGIAERMAESGNWLRLDYRGEHRIYDTFLNAPLHYWARATLIQLFGSNEWTMRAPSALGAVFAVLATLGLGTRISSREAGLLAAIGLATTFQFVYLHGARTGELDTWVTAATVFAAWSFLRAVEDDKSFLPHHLSLAVLGMTKAPLVLVPIASALLWFFESEESRRSLRRYLLTGLAVLPLAAAWHGLQVWWNADRVLGVIGTFAGQASGDDPDFEALGFLGNLRYYAGVLLYGAFPYSVVFPLALAAVALRPRPHLLFVAIQLGALVLFFGLVAKHYAWYVLPLYPFLAILLADWIRDLFGRGLSSPLAWALGFVAAALIVVDVDPWGTNPFASRALVFPMDVRGHELFGLSPWLVFFGLGATLTGGLVLARKQTELYGRVLGMALLVVLAAVAIPRALAPLRFVGHQTPLARTHAEIRSTLANGGGLAFPLRIEGPSLQIARFYFADDFELVPTRGRSRTHLDLLLYPRGHPEVLDLSIGRMGLESRLARSR